MTDATNPAKQSIVDHERALGQADTTGRKMMQLRQELADAELAHADALREADRLYGVAYGREMLEAMQVSEGHERRHARACGDHKRRIEKRRKDREKRGAERTAPEAIKVFTVDGATHDVVSAHELMLGGTGLLGACSPGSRFKAACGMMVDAPHEELDDDRFDQGPQVSCASCLESSAKMDAGEIPSMRGDYLSSKEQLAHTRAAQQRANRAASGRNRP